MHVWDPAAVLCGRRDWDASQLTAVGGRYAGMLAVHHLTHEALPDALHDVDGHAFRRLGEAGGALPHPA
jgi:hypothetical protein